MEMQINGFGSEAQYRGAGGRMVEEQCAVCRLELKGNNVQYRGLWVLSGGR